MSEPIESTTDGRGAAGGVAAIVFTGMALGLAFNFAGLHPGGWGLDWVAEDKLATMPSLEAVGTPSGDGGGGGSGGYNQIDDPMAVPAAAGSANGVPQVPDLDRPIQVELDAVRQFVAAGAALIIDAREPDEFAEGRLPGAINLPYDVAAGDPVRLENLSADGRPIIVYCGGGACELSLSLAYELIYAGQSKVLVYMGGYPEWVDDGQPVERGPAGREAS